MSQIIWNSPDERGIYTGECRRISEGSGMLVLLRNGQIVKQAPVPLAFGSRFGPDVNDALSWNKILTSWANELDKADAN